MYWQYLDANISNSHQGINECHSAAKLKEAYQDLEDITNIQGRNDMPCDEMLLLGIDSINNNPNPQPKDISIKFHYTEKIYEEISYDKKYSFEMLLYLRRQTYSKLYGHTSSVQKKRLVFQTCSSSITSLQTSFRF